MHTYTVIGIQLNVMTYTEIHKTVQKAFTDDKYHTSSRTALINGEWERGEKKHTVNNFFFSK